MMEQDIKEQSSIIGALVDKYIKNYCILLDLPLLIKRICLIASGSSYNASMYAKYFFENISHIPTNVEYASEFINRNQKSCELDTLYIFISQSGFSSDTLEALKMVKRTGAKALALTNNDRSDIYDLADYKFNIQAGPELAIAATKTFTATVFMLWMMACKVAQNRHIDINSETKNIYAIAKSMDDTIENIDNLDVAAKFLSKQKDFSTCGHGINFPLSNEAALKIQETSYINIGSYPMGEFIHGHFALLNKSKVLLTFMTANSSEQEKKLIRKIHSTYKTKTVLITDSYEDYNSEILIKIPQSRSQITTIINFIISVQLLALKIAYVLNRNVDKPKGLNKIVNDKEL